MTKELHYWDPTTSGATFLTYLLAATRVLAKDRVEDAQVIFHSFYDRVHSDRRHRTVVLDFTEHVVVVVETEDTIPYNKVVELVGSEPGDM